MIPNYYHEHNFYDNKRGIKHEIKCELPNIFADLKLYNQDMQRLNHNHNTIIKDNMYTILCACMGEYILSSGMCKIIDT